ncbi:Unknown protein, partial [Striga hermonthica]
NSQIRHRDSLTTLLNQKSSIKDLHSSSGTWSSGFNVRTKAVQKITKYSSMKQFQQFRKNIDGRP